MKYFLAQTSSINDLITKIVEHIINPALQVGFAIATVLFLWGLLKYLMAKQAGDITKSSDGRRHMIWGVVGLFIMFGVFGIMRIIAVTLGADLDLVN